MSDVFMLAFAKDILEHTQFHVEKLVKTYPDKFDPTLVLSLRMGIYNCQEMLDDESKSVEDRLEIATDIMNVLSASMKEMKDDANPTQGSHGNAQDRL